MNHFERLPDFFYSFFSRFKWWLLALYIYIVSWSLFYLPQIEITNSPEAFFPEKSPIVERFLTFKKNYEGRDFLIILYESKESILRPEARLKSKKVGEKLATLPFSEYMISLDTISIPFVEEVLKKKFPIWVTQFFRPFSSLFPPTLSEAQAEKVLEQVPFLNGLLVSEDRKAGIFFLFLKEVPPSEQKDLHEWVIPEVEKILGEESFFQFAYFGTPRVHYELMHSVKEDERFFVPAATFLFILMLSFLFRSVFCVVLPLGIVSVALGILMGFMGYHQIAITMLTALLPPLILVVGVANIIHILVCYSQKRSQGKKDPVYETFVEMWSPCFWTTFTTMIGFGSLVVSQIIPIREFGLLTAVGCLMCFLFSMSSILLFFPFLEKIAPPRASVFSGFIERIVRVVLNYPKLVCSLFLFITGLSIYGMTFIQVESNFIRYFNAKSSIYRDAHYIQERLGSVGNLEILVTPRKNVPLARQLKALEEMSHDLKATKHYRGSLSILDPLSSLSFWLYGQQGLPESEADILTLVESFLSGSKNMGMEQLYLRDFEQFRFTYRLPLLSSKECTRFVQELKTTLNQKYQAYFIVEATGATEAYLAIADQIVEQQVLNFSIAFVFITIALTCIFQSLKTALFAMIPNIFPILFTFGIMGFAGIELNTSTIMVASVAMGMAVDDTIHFICRLKKEFLRNPDYRTAITQTLQKAGPAMISTSLILSVGFSIVCFGSFVPTQHFGFLVVITIISALFADLFFLSSLVLWFRPKLFVLGSSGSSSGLLR